MNSSFTTKTLLTSPQRHREFFILRQNHQDTKNTNTIEKESRSQSGRYKAVAKVRGQLLCVSVVNLTGS
jgi:hypothetical protein